MPSADYLTMQHHYRKMVFSSTALLAAGATDQSPFLDVRTYGHLHVYKDSTGGTYQFQIAWSYDGTTAFFTETITVNDISRNTPVQCNAMFAKIIVTNTHGSVAFSTHHTVVHADANE